MYKGVEGPKSDLWSLDPELRKLAMRLVNENLGELGHIDLDKVVFCSVTGGAHFKWWGKCFLMSTAVRLLPLFVAEQFSKMDQNFSIDPSFLDPRYIIAINQDGIHIASMGDTSKLVEITLFHELKHINEDMTKLVKHDTQDFKSILRRYGVDWQVGIINTDDGVETS